MPIDIGNQLFQKGEKGMKVLVTGGAGFIGSHVVEELLKCQYKVAVIDNLATGASTNLSGKVKLYQMDLNDLQVETVFELESPDYVIHLAAQVSVTKSMKDPYFDFLTNTVGTVKIVSLSKQFNVRKLIFASTAAVYGEPTYYPIDEHHSKQPLSFYSLSKNAAENYIELYGKNNELDNCILRFSNVYGPRQNPNGEAGVVSIMINRLLDDSSVNIFDGSQTRDFIYVKDVAVACRHAMESRHTGVFNISSCTETAIGDLYYLLAEMTGKRKLPVYKPRRTEEIIKSVLDNRKAMNELEWRLNYSLSDGLKETVQYYAYKLREDHLEKTM